MKSNSRNGFTLIETLAALGVASIFFVFCARYLTAVLRTETQGARSLMRTRNIDKLAHQFRDDIHRSNNVTHQPPAENATDELHLSMHPAVMSPDISIVYRIDENKVIRERRSKSGIRGSETFLLDNTTCSFDVSKQPSWASLVLNSKQGLNTKASQQTGNETSIEYRVEAAIGRQYRFAPNSSETQEPNASPTTDDDKET